MIFLEYQDSKILYLDQDKVAWEDNGIEWIVKFIILIIQEQSLNQIVSR